MRVAIWINTWGVALGSLGEGKNLLEKLQYFREVSCLQCGRRGLVVNFESDTELSLNNRPHLEIIITDHIFAKTCHLST